MRYPCCGFFCILAGRELLAFLCGAFWRAGVLLGEAEEEGRDLEVRHAEAVAADELPDRQEPAELRNEKTNM